MAFIDELTIHAKAGDGGDGVVRWRHEKFRPMAGPSGGNGGNGGDVYIVAVRDIHLLSKYRTERKFNAEDGGPGDNDSLYGKNGESLYIQLPIGSLITNRKDGTKYELVEDKQEIKILSGGRGGRGNESFKSSVNRSPIESTPGTPAEEGDFFIELQLFADIGLIGFPNAGKTSLLNEITRAHGKIGDYPFTTIEPNLGEIFGYIIADIPGLIEGASEGKGLGHKFLRHIKRTKVLAHLVSLENENPLETYKMVRRELDEYDTSLTEKKELVILSKMDMITTEDLEKIVKQFKKEGIDVLTESAFDDESLKKIGEEFVKSAKESH